jgi:hypothetical protein
MNSAWFQQDGVRSHTSTVEENGVKPVSALFEKSLSSPPTSTNLNPRDYFPWGDFKDRLLQKNLHTIPELETAIQSEIEALSTETLTKVPNIFVLPLHKVHILRRYCKENI